MLWINNSPNEYIPITVNGYLYTYVTNESVNPNTSVYFDDFSIVHLRSTSALQVGQTTDYYPFGLSMAAQSYQKQTALDNDYLYNGKELQDEHNLGWLDYGARMYDPAIARWSAVDNLAEKYHSLSPYHYAGNIPVRNIDIDGNEFTESGKKWAKKLWGEISNRISANNEKMGKKMAALESGRDKNGKALSDRKADRYERQIGRLQENNKALTGVANEIIALENSSQVYNVVESSSLNEAGPVQGMGNTVAATSFNFNTGAVDITISSNAGLGMFAHELKHAYQFDAGHISLGSMGEIGSPFLLDKHDEVARYQRQALFGSRKSGASGITSLPGRYDSLPTGPADVNNFNYQGRPISQMNQYERNQLSKMMKQAYRMNGTTYKGR
jgi:RHS repeat-associated protein